MPASWARLAGISWKPHCNRHTLIAAALAIAELQGAGAALVVMQELAADARLAEYQPYWAARAELLAKAGERGEAREAYEIAIGLERDVSVRRFLQERQAT